MNTVMSLAVGLAIGYFVYQFVASGRRLRIRGQIHRSVGQIHRSVVNRKVAGVCGGIGEWLGVDPTIVRLAWVLLTLGWGTGVLLYAAFALALPVGISSVTETEK